MIEEVTVNALIIEDEPAISSLCRRILTGEGFYVTIVDNGQDAEEAVAAQEYDLLLVDIRLPVESGLDFYVWLVQTYPRMAGRVVFMTGGMMGGETMRLLEKSKRPYLMKPFRPFELKGIIADIHR